MGKIPKPWNTHGSITFTDSLTGNDVTLPTLGAFSMIFSAINIIKSMIEFNIIQVHINEIKDSTRFFKFIGCCLYHLPFLSTAAYFRISFFVLSVMYLGNFAVIPIGLFWIANLTIGYRHFQRSRHLNPLWLISFVSILMPVCFSMKKIEKR